MHWQFVTHAKGIRCCQICFYCDKSQFHVLDSRQCKELDIVYRNYMCTQLFWSNRLNVISTVIIYYYYLINLLYNKFTNIIDLCSISCTYMSDYVQIKYRVRCHNLSGKLLMFAEEIMSNKIEKLVGHKYVRIKSSTCVSEKKQQS